MINVLGVDFCLLIFRYCLYYSFERSSDNITKVRIFFNIKKYRAFSLGNILIFE